MSIFEIIFIAVGLGMDAATVSMSNGIAFGREKGAATLLAPVAFGAFQGIMPLIGYFIGGAFINIFFVLPDILICVILCGIGLKMLWDGICDEQAAVPEFGFWMVIAQAVATSIDALVVGIGFRALNVDIYSACAVIAAVTWVMSAASCVAGRAIGKRVGARAGIIGGAILIIIGIKALF